MEEDRIIRPGQLYRHFKNKLYQIVTVAIHSETGEKMVVYQALYGDFKTYVRPLSMFMSQVDFHKYPKVQQKYRFELIKPETLVEANEEQDEIVVRKIRGIQQGDFYTEKTDDSKEITIMEPPISKEEEESKVVNPILMEFLDANTYEKKLEILIRNKKHITDKILNGMAISMDCTVDEGAIEERIQSFVFCLQTFAKFENNRLR